MSTLIPINILIGDRNYRIKCEPENEEVIRKTVKTINDKIIEFKTQFAGKDMQDYIAMAIIWFATLPPDQPGSTNQEEVISALSRLETQLDSLT